MEVGFFVFLICINHIISLYLTHTSIFWVRLFPLLFLGVGVGSAFFFFLYSWYVLITLFDYTLRIRVSIFWVRLCFCFSFDVFNHCWKHWNIFSAWVEKHHISLCFKWVSECVRLSACVLRQLPVCSFMYMRCMLLVAYKCKAPCVPTLCIRWRFRKPYYYYYSFRKLTSIETLHDTSSVAALARGVIVSVPVGLRVQNCGGTYSCLT